MQTLAKLILIPFVAIWTLAGYKTNPTMYPMPDYSPAIKSLTESLGKTNQEVSTLKSDQTKETKLGSFSPTGGQTYRLQSSIGLSDTTINLSSFKEPISGISYTMSYLGSSIEYGTLDPQNPNRSEFVSFTGITQNSDGTAQLTGVVRGLSRTPGTGGCVASTTLAQTHSGQSFFILSNSPCFYSQYPTKANNEVITGQWTFNTFPITPSFASSSETTFGSVQLGTGLQTASSTATGTLGRLVIPTTISTSTYNSATAALRVVVTQNSGKIDSNFISTSTLGIATLASTTSFTNGLSLMNIGKNIQTFTGAGTSTFSVPSGVLRVVVQMVGGGGGGGADATGCCGGSGGGGAYVSKVIDLTGTTSVQVYVGDGGAGGTASAAGVIGRASFFGTNGFYLTAAPGVGGGGQVGAGLGSGGLGGTASGGDINVSGAAPLSSGTTLIAAGYSHLGTPGGSGYGGGGGGGSSGNGTVGNTGIIIVNW